MEPMHTKHARGRLGKSSGPLAMGLVALCMVITTTDVWATPRKNNLSEQPAVRHRYEYRQGRFEIGPAFSIALNRAFRHSILLGARLAYHITDWLSIGGDIGYGVNFDTGLTGELESRFDDSEQDRWTGAHARLSNITVAGDVRATITPWSGKLGIFSSLFLDYDFYAFGGFGFALLENDVSDGMVGIDGTPIDKAAVDETNSGFRPGVAWGVGMHLFWSHFVSMGLEFRDLMFSDNESGGDITRGLSDKEIAANKVLLDGDDKNFLHHFFFGVNLTFFLPTSVEISD